MLLDLDQLESFAAGPFEHHRAGVAELVGLAELDALATQLRHPGVEIGDAERDRLVTKGLHDDAFRSLQIDETAATGALDALGARFRDLRLGQPEHTTGAGPGVAADEDGAAFVAGVERQELHLRARLELRER